jgi:hypothetical protein
VRAIQVFMFFDLLLSVWLFCFRLADNWTRRHKPQLSALNPSTCEFEAENNQAQLTRPHLR